VSENDPAGDAWQISPALLEKARKCFRAAELRAKAWSWKAIAADLGLDSPQAAYKAAEIACKMAEKYDMRRPDPPAGPLIPSAWVEASFDRWRAWDVAGRPEREGRKILGVAVTGGREYDIAVRSGDVVTVTALDAEKDGQGLAAVEAAVREALESAPGSVACVDVMAYGAAVYEQLCEDGLAAQPVNPARKTARRDLVTGLICANTWTWAWCRLRDELDPARGATLALPPNDQLAGDLTSLYYRGCPDGKVEVLHEGDRWRGLRAIACLMTRSVWEEAYSFTGARFRTPLEFDLAEEPRRAYFDRLMIMWAQLRQIADDPGPLVTKHGAVVTHPQTGPVPDVSLQMAALKMMMEVMTRAQHVADSLAARLPATVEEVHEAAERIRTEIREAERQAEAAREAEDKKTPPVPEDGGE
jgi:hypothetical protein